MNTQKPNPGRPNNWHNSQQKRQQDDKPKTMEDFQKLAKAQYFKKRYAEILNFEQTQHPDELLQETETFVKALGSDINTHQLRQVFSRVKAAENINALKLLRPKLAYVAARVDKDGAKQIVALLEGLIREASDKIQLANFKLFFEALVAYHKFYHGSKK
jgi:CRISPR type III-A-associated protein Csm2